MMQDDQSLRLSPDFFSDDPRISKETYTSEKIRAQEACSILKKIGVPSAQNIGLDGCRALWIIALHNVDYRDFAQTLLKKMRSLYYRNKQQVFYPGIPYLTDRIMLNQSGYDHSARQLYGTQAWMIINDDGTHSSAIYPIKCPATLEKRRHRYGLVSPGEVNTCEHARGV